jgi:hypothetical protein
MAKDFIPDTDADLETWGTQFAAGTKTNMTALGLTQAQVDAVGNGLTAWIASRGVQETAKAAWHVTVAAQGKSREGLETTIRSTAKTINGVPGADNALRALAHLPAHDEVRTAVGVPTTKPLGRLETKSHYTVIIHFVDETTPLKSAKPAGIHGCRIYTHVGAPAPADITGYTFLALDTRTPYTDVHAAADAGKTVYYLLQWENTKGAPGPISDVLSTTIPA